MSEEELTMMHRIDHFPNNNGIAISTTERAYSVKMKVGEGRVEIYTFKS